MLLFSPLLSSKLHQLLLSKVTHHTGWFVHSLVSQSVSQSVCLSVFLLPNERRPLPLQSSPLVTSILSLPTGLPGVNGRLGLQYLVSALVLKTLSWIYTTAFSFGEQWAGIFMVHDIRPVLQHHSLLSSITCPAQLIKTVKWPLLHWVPQGHPESNT